MHSRVKVSQHSSAKSEVQSNKDVQRLERKTFKKHFELTIIEQQTFKKHFMFRIRMSNV